MGISQVKSRPDRCNPMVQPDVYEDKDNPSTSRQPATMDANEVEEAPSTSIKRLE